MEEGRVFTHCIPNPQPLWRAFCNKYKYPFPSKEGVGPFIHINLTYHFLSLKVPLLCRLFSTIRSVLQIHNYYWLWLPYNWYQEPRFHLRDLVYLNLWLVLWDICGSNRLLENTLVWSRLWFVFVIWLYIHSLNHSQIWFLKHFELSFLVAICFSVDISL